MDLKHVILTKKAFFALSPGGYLVSRICKNIGENKIQPYFCEYIVPLDDREEQWKRIKSVRCDGRKLAIFRCREDAVILFGEWCAGCETPEMVIPEESHVTDGNGRLRAHRLI